MERLYLIILLFVAVVVVIVTTLDYVFADRIILIELKETLTMTDRVTLND